MAFKIGFAWDDGAETETAAREVQPELQAKPRRSVVQVQFPDRGLPLAYYNDRFDLHCGDIVYVDGKLEGKRGRVVAVNYNFRIRLGDYKRIIAVADTKVSGRFYSAGSYFVSFDRNALPPEKARGWFKAPRRTEDEYVTGTDDSSFPLQELAAMNARPEIYERGLTYFREDRVRYLCLDGAEGYAVVEGSESYEIEFICENGSIRALTCSCFCPGTCKHEVAAMLSLRETLSFLRKHYAAELERTGFFSAVYKPLLLSCAVDSRETGMITL